MPGFKGMKWKWMQEHNKQQEEQERRQKEEAEKAAKAEAVRMAGWALRNVQGGGGLTALVGDVDELTLDMASCVLAWRCVADCTRLLNPLDFVGQLAHDAPRRTWDGIDLSLQWPHNCMGAGTQGSSRESCSGRTAACRTGRGC